MLLLDNREVRTGWDELKGHVAGIFGKHGIEVKSSRRWDERRLAYPIKRQQRATYLLMYLSAEPAKITAVRRDLQFDEKVLRDQIMACEQIPEDAFEPEEAFDHTAVQIEEEPVVEQPAEKPAEKPTAEDAPAEGESQDAGEGSDAPAEAQGEAQGDQPAAEDKPADDAGDDADKKED